MLLVKLMIAAVVSRAEAWIGCKAASIQQGYRGTCLRDHCLCTNSSDICTYSLLLLLLVFAHSNVTYDSHGEGWILRRKESIQTVSTTTTNNEENCCCRLTMMSYFGEMSGESSDQSVHVALVIKLRRLHLSNPIRCHPSVPRPLRKLRSSSSLVCPFVPCIMRQGWWTDQSDALEKTTSASITDSDDRWKIDNGGWWTTAPTKLASYTAKLQLQQYPTHRPLTTSQSIITTKCQRYDKFALGFKERWRWERRENRPLLFIRISFLSNHQQHQ